MAIQSTPQDLAATYSYWMLDMNEPEIFHWYTPIKYSVFVVLLEEEQEEVCQRPRQAPRKARQGRDPPAQVSRRFSEVSPPIYL